MSLNRGVLFVSHQSAQIIEFSEDAKHVVKKEQHAVPTRQHASGVRSEHEFFASVCDQIEGFAQVLVTGGHTPLADLRHYVDKHRPNVAPRIAGYEVVDHLTENQLVALARKRFDEYARLA
jgi:hypothetical protein